jgi:hypothetical protein
MNGINWEEIASYESPVNLEGSNVILTKVINDYYQLDPNTYCQIHKRVSNFESLGRYVIIFYWTSNEAAFRKVCCLDNSPLTLSATNPPRDLLIDRRRLSYGEIIEAGKKNPSGHFRIDVNSFKGLPQYTTVAVEKFTYYFEKIENIAETEKPFAVSVDLRGIKFRWGKCD